MPDQDQTIVTKGDDAYTSDSDAGTDSNEYYDSESNQLKQIDCEDEFGDAKLEELVSSEGPQEILRLMLHEQVDGFMAEEVTDADDYADWIRWVSDAEQSRQAMYDSTHDIPVPLLLQQPSPDHNSSIPMLLQTVQVKNGKPDCKPTEQLASSSHHEMDIRSREIRQRIRIDTVKKDASRRFYGNYRPLNAQMRRDSFPMSLVEDVINQLGNSLWYDGSHQLCVVDVVSGEEQPKEVVSGEAEAANRGKLVQNNGERMVVKRRRPQYFDKWQQLDLVLEAQELAEFRDHELSPTESDDEEDQEMDARCIDIWKDAVCLGLLKEGVLPNTVDFEESKKARKRVSNYCWKEQRLHFKGLLVPKPEERISLVSQMHEELGHFGEQRTLAEIRRRADNYLHVLTVETDAGATMVKMKKPGKRRALTASWEGPYQFIGHADGKGDLDFEDGNRVCIIQDADGHQWERSRQDLQIYHVPPD
ncbi:unnamed protein product [Sphagnum jensenii]